MFFIFEYRSRKNNSLNLKLNVGELKENKRLPAQLTSPPKLTLPYAEGRSILDVAA